MNNNKIKDLLKILIEWSLKNKEYHMTLFIYSNFNIGIPNKLLYKLPEKNTFSSVSSFLNTNDNRSIDDYNLKQLFDLFLKSKFTNLENWNNSIGYRRI